MMAQNHGCKHIKQVAIYIPGSSDFTSFTVWGQCSVFSATEEIHKYQLFFPPITVRWTEPVWIQSLCQAFIHDQRCGYRNPRPLDLGSNALTIQPRALHDKNVPNSRIETITSCTADIDVLLSSFVTPHVCPDDSLQHVDVDVMSV